MWSREDLAWLAGLFEGEGSYCTAGQPQYVVRIGMTDPDVLRRARDLSGMGAVHGPYSRGAHWKPIYIWVIGKEHQAYAFMVAIFPWLGVRRRADAISGFTTFRDRPRRILSQHKRDAVVDDWRRTGASQWTLARRHGISRSRVQQLIAAARTQSR